MKLKCIAIVLAPRASAFADEDSAERDTAALSLALELANQSGASTIALTVAAPLQSANVCEEALRLGCDQAICIRAPVQVDYLGTATLLAHVLRDKKPDVIVCGDHYADNGNAAVAGSLARILDWQLMTGVLAAKNNSKGIWVQTRTDFGQQEQQCRGQLVLAALQTRQRAIDLSTATDTTTAEVEELFADSLLEDTSILRARSSMAGYAEFAASRSGVELISEPAELLSRLLKEKLWTP